jgi:hypothetical protein
MVLPGMGLLGPCMPRDVRLISGLIYWHEVHILGPSLLLFMLCPTMTSRFEDCYLDRGCSSVIEQNKPFEQSISTASTHDYVSDASRQPLIQDANPSLDAYPPDIPPQAPP